MRAISVPEERVSLRINSQCRDISHACPDRGENAVLGVYTTDPDRIRKEEIAFRIRSQAGNAVKECFTRKPTFMSRVCVRAGAVIGRRNIGTGYSHEQGVARREPPYPELIRQVQIPCAVKRYPLGPCWAGRWT